MARAIPKQELTLDDLVGFGVDAVNDRLPLPLLIAAARRYVGKEHAKRERNEAKRVERRAYGATASSAPDQIDARILAVSTVAAGNAEVNWAQLLDVPVVVTEGSRRTWGEATVEEHLLIAERYEKQGAGHVRTASMHRAAAADIDDAKQVNLHGFVARRR